MKNEKISLDKLKEMKEVLENKNTLLMNPIMPTILGYSIKEIVDEFIKEKIKYEMPEELINMFRPPILKVAETYRKSLEERRKKEREQEKIKTEMIDDVLKHHFPLNGHYTASEVCIYAEGLRKLSPESFKTYMINFYTQRFDEKIAEGEEIIKKMKKL